MPIWGRCPLSLKYATACVKLYRMRRNNLLFCLKLPDRFTGIRAKYFGQDMPLLASLATPVQEQGISDVAQTKKSKGKSNKKHICM